MFKLQYAKPHEMGMLSVHVAPDWRYEAFDVIVAGTQTTDRRHFLQLTSGISYSILDYLEFRFHAASFMKYYETNNFPQHRYDPSPPYGIKNLEFALKMGYPFIIDKTTPFYYAIGLDGYVDVGLELHGNARAHDSSFYAGSFEGITPHFPPYITHDPDFGFNGLGTFRIGPFATNLNIGYLLTGSDKNPGYVTASDFQHLQRPNYITHGFGLELIPVEALRVLFEVYGFYNTQTSKESLWVTPGLRFGSTGVSFDLGCELGILNEADIRYYKPFFNLSYGFDLVKRVEVHVPIAKVSGKIYDAKTNAPVIATITLPGSNLGTIQTTEYGTYEMTATPGSYRFHVDAPGYLWKEQGVVLKDGEQTVLDFNLNKVEVIIAILTGKISDAETGGAIAARITLADTNIYKVATDSTTGIYKAIIPPGLYSIKVEAENYFIESAPIILAKDETKIQNFTLKKIPIVPKVGEKIILKGIYFDFNSAIIKPESYPVLDDAAKVLQAKPKMRVEIGGHTDTVGSDSYNQKLSYERAQAVKDYLVRYHNIDSMRLDVRGYGETQPIGDNRTKAGRDLNRRIEFRILSVD